MILDWSKVRVFVKPGPTDMRKQINGLSIIVSEQLKPIFYTLEAGKTKNMRICP